MFRNPATALLGLLFTAQALAQPLKTTRLTIFKNNTFFHKQEGTVAVKDRTAKLDLPKTVLKGTWFLAPLDGNKITRVAAVNDTIKLDKAAKGEIEFLKSNVGSGIEVVLKANHNQPATTIAGTLLAFDHELGLLQIKTADKKGIMFLNLEDVNYFTFLSASIKGTHQRDSVARRAMLTLKDKSTDLKLVTASLQTGMRWLPSYILKMTGDKKAQLVMKATIENDVEDIRDAQAELVVGEPQLAYGLELDPIVTETYLAPPPQPAPRVQNFFRKKSRATAAAPEMAMAAMAPASDMVSEEPVNTEGIKREDLYFYKTDRFSLNRGQKAIIPVFSQEVAIEQRYEAYISDFVTYVNSRQSRSDNQRFSVSNIISVKNDQKAPLTTAPLFVVDADEAPIAQTTLNYTAAGDKSDVTLNTAPDVVVKNQEEELKRQEAIRVEKNIVYDRAEIGGKIELANYLEKSITLIVKKEYNGTSLSTDGASELRRARYYGTNPNTLLTWSITLKPGEKKTLNYKYEVSIQNYR